MDILRHAWSGGLLGGVEVFLHTGSIPVLEAFAPVLGIKTGAARPLEAILAPLPRAYLAYSLAEPRMPAPGFAWPSLTAPLETPPAPVLALKMSRR